MNGSSSQKHGMQHSAVAHLSSPLPLPFALPPGGQSVGGTALSLPLPLPLAPFVSSPPRWPGRGSHRSTSLSAALWPGCRAVRCSCCHGRRRRRSSHELSRDLPKRGAEGGLRPSSRAFEEEQPALQAAPAGRAVMQNPCSPLESRLSLDRLSARIAG